MSGLVDILTTHADPHFCLEIVGTRSSSPDNRVLNPMRTENTELDFKARQQA